MAQAKGNKAKGRQSAKKAGYYKNQFYVTIANKLRREKQRKRKADKRAARTQPQEPQP